MAAPANLYKIELTGRWEYGMPMFKTKLFEWAMTWYCTGSVVSDAPTVLVQAYKVWQVWFLENQQPNAILTEGTVLEKARAIRVASGAFAEDVQDLEPIARDPVTPIAPQVAMLVVGRSEVLGRQTRKWIPCLAPSWYQAGRPEWNIDPFVSPVRDFAHESLTAKAGIGITLTPAVYDATNEIARGIDEILIQPIPRSIRRRSMRPRQDLVPVGP